MGETLSATSGTWAGSPTPSLSYQWQEDAAGNEVYADIDGETGNTLLLDADREGNQVRCVVTGTNSQGSDTANSNATAAVVAAAGLTAPDITVTSAANDPPEIDLVIPEDVFAGFYLDVQRSDDGLYSPTTLDISYQITALDLSDGITNVELAVEGYTDPTGLYYQRYRFRREDGVTSAWVEITGTVTSSTATWATSDGVNKNSGLSLANGNLTLIAESTAGTNQSARASIAAAADEFYFEVTVTAFDSDTTGGIRTGITNGTQSFSGASGNIGGSAITDGFTLRFEPDSASMQRWFNGAIQSSVALGANPTAGAVVGVHVNKTTRVVNVYYDADGSGMSSTAINTFTLNVGNVPAAWYAYGCCERGQADLTDCDKLTANFGGSAFAIGGTLPGSAVFYG